MTATSKEAASGLAARQGRKGTGLGCSVEGLDGVADVAAEKPQVPAVVMGQGIGD
jgi:hypothetical protein